MEMTPMMQQYLATKEQNPGAILFFRLGDFYEMFFEDAKLVSKELGLTLTSRSKGQDAPMCGVPYHAAETYVNKLVKRGYKVAIAEQIGDPKAKGLTKREVIKVVTPGTILSESALQATQNNYIALIYEAGEKIVLAGADISTGECFYGIYEGGIIKTGYNEELDEYRRISHDSKAMLQEIEEREKEQTGIKALKIGYNKVFGYYIEVRHSGADRVPDRYIRKQTLANAERYITEELKEFETKILGAQEKIVNIEYNLFTDVREEVKAHLTEIQQTAHEIALVDVLASLAEAASTYNYVRPSMRTDGVIDIKDGRHPLVERILTRDLFVPNDAHLDHKDCEIMLITGPNMAGKSTYMRQVALLTLMAQIGSFIPAREAAISPVDRIFTRIGASDDLVSGQSTFMVEMNEVAQILKYATKDSLVILDEIGRGTSTFDGMSIARAVIEHIEKKVHAKTLFATHYHELTDLEDDKIKNYCVAVKERGNQVAFLRRIVRGAADKSYGIHVARLAGLPKSVTSRAEEILAMFEAEAPDAAAAARAEQAEGRTAKAEPAAQDMGSLFASSLSDTLLALDVMTMTPLEAMNELYRLQEQAKREAGKA